MRLGPYILQGKSIKSASACAKMFQSYNNHFLQRFVLKKQKFDELATFFTEGSLEWGLCEVLDYPLNVLNNKHFLNSEISEGVLKALTYETLLTTRK